VKEESIKNARCTQSQDPMYQIIRIFDGTKNNTFVPENHVGPQY